MARRDENTLYVIAMPLDDYMQAKRAYPDFPWDQSLHFETHVRAMNWLREQGISPRSDNVRVIYDPRGFLGVRKRT